MEFANALAFSAFVPFLALWLTGPVGMSAAAAGITGFAVYSATAVAGSALGGWLSDRIGARHTMMFGLGAGTARLAGLALTDDPLTVTALIAFGGLVDSTVQPASGALVSARVPLARMAEGYGTIRAARTVGLGLGPVAGAALVSVSFSTVLLAAAACRAAAFTAALFVHEPLRVPPALGEGGREAVIHDLPFVRILAAVGVLALFYGWYETVVPIHLEARGFGVSSWGAIYAGGALFTALLAIRVARLIDQWPRFQRWVALAGAVYGAGFVLLLPAMLPTVLVGVALVAVAQIILNPIESTLAARMAPADRPGVYQGALSSVHAIAFATGPALGLALYDATSAATTFLIAACVLPVGGLALSAVIGAAAVRRRLGLTEVPEAESVTPVETSLIASVQQYERWVADAETRLERIDRRYRKTLAAQEKWIARLGLGTALAVAGVAGLAVIIVHQLGASRGADLKTNELIAVLAATTVVAVAGCAYQFVSRRTQRNLAEARLKRLEQAEQEAQNQLHDARMGLIDALRQPD